MHLSRFPRLRFAYLPTPLEPLDKLSVQLGGPRPWIKRDDCSGLATAGNKARKLEFLIAGAIEKGTDTIITHAATRSNHARQTAAIAAQQEMACYILLEDRTVNKEESYNYNGNVLLDRLYGVVISKRSGNADMNREMEILAEDLRARGKDPYIIPGGASNPIGALGYVNAALEPLSQAIAMGLKLDYVVPATGSGGTQAGLVTGHSGMEVATNMSILVVLKILAQLRPLPDRRDRSRAEDRPQR